MPFPMFLLADLLWLSTPVWLGVECFKRWNKVFHALKLLVPSNETFSFKALKLEFQVLETKVSRWRNKSFKCMKLKFQADETGVSG